jgi:DNA-binding IclR family transcriptional regulator
MSGQVLANALKVLGCFSASRPDWGVTELSEHTGLTKSHVCKILRSFLEQEFIIRDAETRRYRVGPRSLLLGAGFATGSRLVRRAEPFLRELTRDTSFTVTLNLSDHANLLFVMAVHGPASGYHSWPAGAHIPLHATAAGKVRAAFLSGEERRDIFGGRLPQITSSTICDPERLHRQLEEVRRTGIASTFGESTRKVGAVAAPIFGDCGDCVGAISLLFPLEGSQPGVDLAPMVKQTANRVSRSIGAGAYPFA